MSHINSQSIPQLTNEDYLNFVGLSNDYMNYINKINYLNSTLKNLNNDIIYQICIRSCLDKNDTALEVFIQFLSYDKILSLFDLDQIDVNRVNLLTIKICQYYVSNPEFKKYIDRNKYIIDNIFNNHCVEEIDGELRIKNQDLLSIFVKTGLDSLLSKSSNNKVTKLN